MALTLTAVLLPACSQIKLVLAVPDGALGNVSSAAMKFIVLEVDDITTQVGRGRKPYL